MLSAFLFVFVSTLFVVLIMPISNILPNTKYINLRYYFLLACMVSFSFVGPYAEAKKSSEPERLEQARPMQVLSIPALSSSDKQVLGQIRPDPPPEEIVRDSHYWVSNEHNHQLWHPFIQGIGGAFVGVGTDQNYLLAGWAKSSVLILMDFDQEIPMLHEIYAYFFSVSSDPDMFLARWSKKYREDSIDQLTRHFTTIAQQKAEREADRKELTDKKRSRYLSKRVKRFVRRRVKTYKLIRGLLWRRLTKTKQKYQELKIGTFLSDQEQYDHIRSLWAGGRVIAVRGDLTADVAMLDIGDRLRELNVTLNVMYLSNAEQYFKLTPSYRRNLIELPWGATSYALRTMGWRSLGFFDEDEKYHYNVQAGDNLIKWMQQSRTTKAGRMMFKGRVIKEPGFSVMEGLPKASTRLPEIAPSPRQRRQ